MVLRKCCLIFILSYACLSSSSLKAQQYKFVFDNQPKAENISSLYVQAMAQDANGFLWIGAENGLFRFDGLVYKKYEADKNIKNSLSHNEILSLFVDIKKRLWVGTRRGLNLYDQINDNFILIDSSNITPCKLANSQVYAINQSVDSSLWIGTLGNGLFKIKEQGNTKNLNKTTCLITNYLHHDNDSLSLPSNTIYDIALDNYQNVWLATTMGITVFNTVSGNQNLFLKFSGIDTLILPQTQWWKLCFDKTSHTIWAITDKQNIVCVNTDKNIFKSKLQAYNVFDALKSNLKVLDFSSTYSIYIDKTGTVWIGSHGLGTATFKFRFNKNEFSIYDFTILQNDPKDASSISSNSVQVFYTDLKNNLWLGTQSGIAKLPSLFKTFQYYKPIRSEVDFSSLNVKAISGLGSEIWIGIDTARIWNISAAAHSRSLNIPLKNCCCSALTPTEVNCILKTPDNNLLIGTFTGLFYIQANDINSFYNGSIAADHIKCFTSFNTNNALCSNVINAFAMDDEDIVWIATGNGLSTFNYRQLTFNKVMSPPTKDSRPEYIIRSLAIDKINKSVWVGTDNGLIKFDKSGTGNYQKKDFKSLKLLSNKINQLLFDENNQLWIANDNGVNCLNISTYNLNAYNSLNGLAANNVKSMACDKNGTIWCGTNNGISVIDKGHNIIRNYSVADGLISSDYNIGSAYCNTYGIIFMGGITGLVSFDPNAIPIDTATQNVLITDFKVLNKSVFSDEKLIAKKNQLIADQSIVLKYNENFFSVDFSSVQIDNPKLIRYKYILENVDPDWVETANINGVTYNGVAPGNYIFKIKTLKYNGRWSDNETNLLIKIKPPFYLTWWFFTLSTIIILTVTAYTVRYFAQIQLREKLREQEKLLAIERERNRISEDLHDDLGAGLSSIAMMTAVMKDLITDEESKETAEEVTVEANELVGRMREIIWSMNSKNDTIENLLTYIHEYCNKYLIKNKIELLFELQGEVPQQDIRGDKRENIFLVVKETLHNAVKYAETKQVTIAITITKKQLDVAVFDHGKGFDMNNIKRFGNGLENMKQRIQKVEGTCEIISAPGQGTHTNISVPL